MRSYFKKIFGFGFFCAVAGGTAGVAFAAIPAGDRALEPKKPRAIAVIPAPTAGEIAAEILRKADEVRNPSDSYLMKIEVASGTQSSLFEVMIRGNERTLIKTLEPARDRGRNMLMLDEDMWAFIPNLNRAVRISLAQKLTGQAANGDISRMRWSGDYTAQIEKENDTEWVLFLTATKKGLTYEKLRVWVEKGSFRPLRAEFLTLSDKPLKRAYYEDYKKLAGEFRPGVIRIQDAVRPDQVSVIKVIDVAVKNFPASLFNQNALR